MKKNIFFLIIILAFGLIPSAQAKTFSDVPKEHSNFIAISYLSDEGILKGYEDGSFQPDKLVNRVEALKVILEESGTQLAVLGTESIFSDVSPEQWFASYVVTAKNLGIVNGHPDGSFTPAANVRRAAFLKMLLEANRFKKDKWSGQQLFADVPADAWFTPYMNYAGSAGLLTADGSENLYPDKELTRAEVAETLYLMRIIMRGLNTQFLLTQSESQMAQIEVYIGENKITDAKRSSELGYDMTQQALKVMPENAIVLGAAKIAKAYDLLVDAYIAGLQKNTEAARTLAELTKIKATEAWEANNEVQAIAKHIKDRADEILSQL